MNKSELLQNITTKSYNKVQLIEMVKKLPGSSKPRLKPTTPKIGDVYMHSVFNHPVVLCKKQGQMWYGIMLTTESKCESLLEPCQSRFFTNSYITTTITSFKKMPMFLGTYDNNKHIREVYKRIKSIML